MGILDRAKEHFAALETKSLEVPEWEVTVYWRPWTVNERQKVMGAVKASGKDAEYSPRVLLAKALDVKGAPIFGKDDLRTLCFDVDSAVVERVAMAIIGEAATPEDTEKN